MPVEEKVLNLSNIYGYARLFATLVKDNVMEEKHLADMLYGWYLSNITAYNDRYNQNLLPLEKEVFYFKLKIAHVKPYKTNIQTIKALTLLDWNMSGRAEHSKMQRETSAFCREYMESFYAEHGYSARDSITSFSLCEDTLDPIYEPAWDLNPGALFRKQDAGMKFVYISAPLRSDVEKNIAYATEKAREVFEEGNIPVCPHLIFPPIADPQNKADDKKAMEMCLKLMERCNEIRVYGQEWTDGMWMEIQHAERMKIPILTDQTKIPQVTRHKRKDEHHER